MSIAAFTSTAKLEVETVLGADHGYVVVAPCLPIVVAPVSTYSPCLSVWSSSCVFSIQTKTLVIARVKTEALIQDIALLPIQLLRLSGIPCLVKLDTFKQQVKPF